MSSTKLTRAELMKVLDEYLIPYQKNDKKAVLQKKVDELNLGKSTLLQHAFDRREQPQPMILDSPPSTGKRKRHESDTSARIGQRQEVNYTKPALKKLKKDELKRIAREVGYDPKSSDTKDKLAAGIIEALKEPLRRNVPLRSQAHTTFSPRASPQPMARARSSNSSAGPLRRQATLLSASRAASAAPSITDVRNGGRLRHSQHHLPFSAPQTPFTRSPLVGPSRDHAFSTSSSPALKRRYNSAGSLENPLERYDADEDEISGAHIAPRSGSHGASSSYNLFSRSSLVALLVLLLAMLLMYIGRPLLFPTEEERASQRVKQFHSHLSALAGEVDCGYRSQSDAEVDVAMYVKSLSLSQEEIKAFHRRLHEEDRVRRREFQGKFLYSLASPATDKSLPWRCALWRFTVTAVDETYSTCTFALQVASQRIAALVTDGYKLYPVQTVLLIGGLFAWLTLYSLNLRRRARRRLLSRLVDEVCDLLRVQKGIAENSSAEGPWVASAHVCEALQRRTPGIRKPGYLTMCWHWLRGNAYIYDEMRVVDQYGSATVRAMWNEVEKRVENLASVAETPRLVEGEQMVCYEWIAPLGTHVTPERRRFSSAVNLSAGESNESALLNTPDNY